MNGVDNPGQGLVVIRSPDGTALATLGNGSGGGGNVTLRDPGGNGVVSAGYVAGDSGPGAACVEHKGTKCLGIGLTGMEGFLSK